MKPKLLGRIASGLVLALALTGCGSDDGGSGGATTGGGGGSTSGGSGGSTSGGSGGSGTGGSSTGGAGTGGLATGGSSGGGGTDAGADGPVEYGPYPAGPYGNNVGDTIALLAWEGYVNVSGAAASDTLPYIDYSTDEMRKSGRAYGLIHISAFT